LESFGLFLTWGVPNHQKTVNGYEKGFEIMMRIVKRGIPKEEILIQAGCRHCDSVIEFSRSEGRITRDQRDGDFVTIICPVCGREIHKNL
jgi:RNase P subunit RPR2